MASKQQMNDIFNFRKEVEEEYIDEDMLYEQWRDMQDETK